MPAHWRGSPTLSSAAYSVWKQFAADAAAAAAEVVAAADEALRFAQARARAAEALRFAQARARVAVPELPAAAARWSHGSAEAPHP